jgi:hypothetical protein
MIKYKIGFALILLALLTCRAPAQDLAVGAGMGFEYYNAPSLAQFLVKRAGGAIPGTYVTAFQLKTNAEYFILSNWTLGVEYAYLVNQSNGNAYQISYSYSLPTLTVHKVLPGDNYYLRFGGGIGYHSFSMSERDPYGGTIDYSAKGIGLKFDVAFDTKLGEDFYARVEGDARAEYTGSFNAADELTPAGNHPSYSSNLSGVGVTFGLVYYF